MCLQYLVAQIRESAADDALALVDDESRAPRCIVPPVDFDVEGDPEAWPYVDHFAD